MLVWVSQDCTVLVFQGAGKAGYKAGEKCATVRAGWWGLVVQYGVVKCCIIGFWFGCCYILLSST